jgi:KTSC domain
MAEMQAVDSSMVSHVGYDPDTKTLHLTYHNGGTYTHPGVPPAKYDALLRSSSIGAYINKQIKPFHPHR